MHAGVLTWVALVIDAGLLGEVDKTADEVRAMAERSSPKISHRYEQRT